MTPQTFNDGVVRFYRTVNTAEPGSTPDLRPTPLVALRYHERTVGFRRFYSASQANVKISKLLRCPRHAFVSQQDIAVPVDGRQYRITLIQYPEDTQPPVMDLTLEEVTQVYELPD